MEKALLTSSQNAAFAGNLTSLLNRIDGHINGNMTVAHGLTLQATDYKNAHGDLLSNQVAVFLIAGRTYYSPVQITSIPMGDTLIPNPAQTTRLGVTTLVPGPSVSAGVTAANDSLTQHAGLTLENAHGGMTATATDTFSSAGYRVGRHLLQFQFNGETQSIIADTRSDGPPKSPNISAPAPGTVYVKEGNQAIFFSVTVTGEGTLTYKWQWFNSVVWADLTDGSVVGSPTPDPPEVTVQATSTPVLQITKASVAGSFGSVYQQRRFRLKVTSSVFPGEEFFSTEAQIFVKAVVN